MLGRPGRIALLAFQAWWLCVVVPGHTRGIVVLPGSSDASCCHPQGKSKPNDADAQKRQQNCAICSFAARLSLAVAIDLTPPPMELLRREATPLAQAAPSIQSLPTYLGRAPPASA